MTIPVLDIFLCISCPSYIAFLFSIRSRPDQTRPFNSNKMTDSHFSDHYSSLTCELKCPCGGYLQPPIRMCTQGHSVCKRCRRSHQQCPTCQEEFTETRSIALETLVDKLLFPCPHPGCKVKSQLKDLDDHASECSMRPTPCFMAKIYPEGCNWRGLASDWLDHCATDHPNRVTELPYVTFSDPWVPRVRNPVMRYHLLKCYERVFNVYQIYHTSSGKMMWSVVMIGNDTDLDNFYFDLEIIKPSDPMRKISYRQSCKNNNDLDILDVSENVILPLEQILYMLDEERCLHFHLTISQMDEKTENKFSHQMKNSEVSKSTAELNQNMIQLDIKDLDNVS